MFVVMVGVFYIPVMVISLLFANLASVVLYQCEHCGEEAAHFLPFNPFAMLFFFCVIFKCVDLTSTPLCLLSSLLASLVAIKHLVLYWFIYQPHGIRCFCSFI